MALAAAQEAARIEEAKKKKKKKKKREDDFDFDEFGDEDDLMGTSKRAEQEEEEAKKRKKKSEPEVEVVMRPKKLSCVRFADGAQIIVTGDDTGAVDVYKIFGVDLGDALHQNKPRELGQLHQAMRPEHVGGATTTD